VAYVQEPEKDDEEQQQEKYAALLGPAAGGSDMGATPTPSVAAPQAPRTSKGFDFVSADRYLNANRDAVNKMNTDAKASLVSRSDKVATGLKDTTADVTTQAQANTLQGPTPTQALTADQKQVNALQELSGQAYTTADQARGLVGANYAGPSRADVANRYGSLFSDYGAVREDVDTAARHGLGAVNKWNSFDSMLSNAGGGKNLKDVQEKVKGLGTAYNEARSTADDAVRAGELSHDESYADGAAGKWGALLGDFESAEKARTDAATEQARKADEADWELKRLMLLGDKAVPGIKGRPKGEELMEAFTLINPVTNTTLGTTWLDTLYRDPGRSAKWTATLNALPDAELKEVMGMLAQLKASGPNNAETTLKLMPAAAQRMDALARKYGVK